MDRIAHHLYDCEMDNSLVKANSGENLGSQSELAQVVQDGVFLQQFPYPCFQRNNFLSGLYTIQLMQVVMFAPTIQSQNLYKVYDPSESNSSLAFLLLLPLFVIIIIFIMILIFIFNIIIIKGAPCVWVLSCGCHLCEGVHLGERVQEQPTSPGGKFLVREYEY